MKKGKINFTNISLFILICFTDIRTVMHIVESPRDFTLDTIRGIINIFGFGSFVLIQIYCVIRYFRNKRKSKML